MADGGPWRRAKNPPYMPTCCAAINKYGTVAPPALKNSAMAESKKPATDICHYRYLTTLITYSRSLANLTEISYDLPLSSFELISVRFLLGKHIKISLTVLILYKFSYDKSLFNKHLTKKFTQMRPMT